MSTTRLPAEQRLEHLLDCARALVREHGADALTLISLAKRAGVTKPITYRHFGTRDGLLTALYRQFDDEQTRAMEAALEAGTPDAAQTARIMATSYVDCALAAGSELGWLTPALQTSPALATYYKGCRARHLERLGSVLSPFAKSPLGLPTLLAMTGAADSLSDAATAGTISREEAISALTETFMRPLDRNLPSAPLSPIDPPAIRLAGG
jgi:AcrR family transcriptional regulator